MNTNYNSFVADHYAKDDLRAGIDAALRRAGKDLDALKPEDLAGLDQFHLGGHAATIALADAAITPGMNVLDLGGGVGGAARTLATAYDCRVTVLDLTTAYCRAGEMLTELTSLQDRVSFRQGSALDIPFAAGSFDAVWTQHFSMNVADKPRLYAEIRRVLRPAGRLALHEIIAGPHQPPYYPVPWARQESMSYLMPEAQMQEVIRAAGLEQLRWEDVSAWSLDWVSQRIDAMRANPTPSPLSLALIMGPDIGGMLVNLRRNLDEGRVRVVRGVFSRS